MESWSKTPEWQSPLTIKIPKQTRWTLAFFQLLLSSEKSSRSFQELPARISPSYGVSANELKNVFSFPQDSQFSRHEKENFLSLPLLLSSLFPVEVATQAWRN